MQVAEGKIRRDKTNEEEFGKQNGHAKRSMFGFKEERCKSCKEGKSEEYHRTGTLESVRFSASSEKHLRQSVLQRKRREERKTHLKKND